MILFNPGIKRRVAAGLCAVALMVTLVAFPLRARAMAPALPAIGYATTIAAFLAACGIYPFENENGESFGEWGARKLTDLWNTYITEVYPQSEAAQVISDVKSFYASGGYMVMARDTWDRLREFAGWIVGKYNVADNQMGAELGEADVITINSAVLSVLDAATAAGYNYDLWRDTISGYAYPATSGGCPALRVSVRAFCLTGRSFEGESPLTVSIYYDKAAGASTGISRGYTSYGKGDGSVMRLTRSYPYRQVQGTYATLLSLSEAELGQDGYVEACVQVGWRDFRGVLADTASIAIPAALPEGAELGGLAVAGAGAGVDALEDVIEGGVMERQQPVVRPVEVEIGAGTDVDTETGEVTGNAIVITPDSVVLSSSDFTLPRAISTVFPFSVPWDIMRVYQALDAEPAFPEIHAYLYVPGSSFVNPDYVDDKIPFIIGIPEDMKPGFDAFAAKFRSIVLLLACIATTWAMVKFFRY